MDHSGTESAMSARDEVLTRGLIDWVPLQRLHYHTAQEYPGEPVSKIQQRVLDLIRSLVDEGLAEVGDLNGPDDRFAAWTTSLDEAIESISRVYVDQFEADTIWPWYAWLSLTKAGDVVAEQIESRSS